MLCCGSFRQCNFCPDCGKQLVFNTPLVGLLVHIRNQAKSKMKQRERLQSLVERGSKRYGEDQLEHAKALEDKWLTWDAEITRILLEWQEKQENPDPEIDEHLHPKDKRNTRLDDYQFPFDEDIDDPPDDEEPESEEPT